MSVFDGLGGGGGSGSIIDPKRLFRALLKPPGSRFRFPHDIQTEVWDAWFDRRTEQDLVLKMNTGSGKTVVGLVIAQSSLNEGAGPAAYLVPDKQLKAQVEIAAAELGIAVTDDPRDVAFRESEAVLIVTVAKLFNGLSQFGVRGRGRTIDVGTLVVDDAHAAIPIIEQCFSLTIPRSIPAYQQLSSIFVDGLKIQSMAGYSGIVSGEGTQSVPVPYWSWQQAHDQAYSILEAATDAPSHQFVWPFLQDQLALCDVAVAPSAVEVRLPYPDVSIIPSFVGASRRVYMTATLADDTILQTQLGVSDECVTRPIAPASASDVGDRIILTPVETSREVSWEDVKSAAVGWAQAVNVVVIVPSRPRAANWADVTSEVHDKDTIVDCVARLNAGAHLGIVVLVARYDGVDLPNEACRVLILDGLPERFSPQELVEAAAIGGTDAMDARQTQRIEQGMGRGIRSNDDYCAVVLLDPRLVERLYTADARQLLSPATRAQYELSRDFSAGGRGQGMQFFDQAVRAFLDRDPAWTGASRTAVENVRYEASATVPEHVTAERVAFDLRAQNRSEEARDELARTWDQIDDARYRGWIKQRAASYLNSIDPVNARGIQRSARIDNNYILKIPNEVRSVRISALSNQAGASSAYLSGEYPTARALEVAADSILLDLVPSTDVNSHKRFEAALERVGWILGFASSRPDQETGVGPDNLWAIGNDHYWVIECKSEALAASVSRDNLEQLSHSADWFEAEYAEPRYSATPVLVHPSATPFWDAVPRQGARVMTFELLEAFRAALRGFLSAVQVSDAYRTPTALSPYLTQFELNSGLLARWTREFDPPPGRP